MIIKLDSVKTAEEALEQAGLNWSVEQSELISGVGKWVKTHKALHRSDSGDILGIVGKSYKAIQNTDAFAFFDTISEKYGARYETAGIIKGGRKIFLQARLNDSFNATTGDKVDNYITL